MKRNPALVELFKVIAQFSHSRPWLVIGAAFLITLIMGYLASTLSIEMTWIDLVPKDNPSVEEFHGITENFGAASNIILAIENEDSERLKEVAREVAEEVAAMTRYFTLVDYRRDQGFFLSHALMLEKAKDLKKSRDMLRSFDLVPFLKAVNDNFERSYIGGEDSLEEDEYRVIQTINSLVDVVAGLKTGLQSENLQESGRLTAHWYIDDALYSFSADKRMLLVTLQPTCTINEMDKIGILVPALREKVEEFKKAYPDCRFRLTGMHIVAQDEIETASLDSMILTNVAFLIILAGFVIAFKMWGAPLLAMLCLSGGIIWNFGITALVIGRLNMMTAMMALILLGLGVDYFVHILSGYTEGRERGLSGEEASVYSMEKVSTGVFVGALTTAIAFYALTLVKMQVFIELGFILGTGILTTMLVSFFLLPAVLAIFPPNGKRVFPPALKILLIILAVLTVLPGLLILVDWINKKFFKGKSGGGSRIFRSWGQIIARRPGRVMISVLVVLAGLGYFIQFNWFDQNLMNIEMKGLESVELQREIVKRYGLTDSAIVYTTESLEETQDLHTRLDASSLVGALESIASYLPSPEHQEERLPYLLEINRSVRNYRAGSEVDEKNLVAEIERLVLNLKEISELATIGGQKLLERRIEEILAEEDERFQTVEKAVLQAPQERLAAFQRGFGLEMKQRFFSMSAPVQITLDDLPPSVLDRYRASGGEQFLTLAYAKTDIWDNVVHSPFISFVQGLIPQVTGMPIFMKVLIEDSVHYGRIAIGIALAIIFLLLMIDFKSLRLVLMALSPLFLGSIALLGILGILRYPFNIMMVAMLPLILGIGIDNGVHLLHRYRIEGADFPVILFSVGKALFLTTFTTMAAFGSLMFAKMRALIGMGLLLFVGIGAIYLVTISFVPAFLSLAEKRLKKRIKEKPSYEEKIKVRSDL